MLDNVVFDVSCFCNGTLIETENGSAIIDEIKAGDLIKTHDHGLQRVRWVGSRRLSKDNLLEFPKLRPIRIRAGALGHNSPTSDLLVSPQHRILVRSMIAQRMFGTSEVLVADKPFVSARLLASGKRARMLKSRHCRNNRRLVAES